MDKKKQLLKAFQRGHLLSLKNPTYRSWIDKFIVDETKGDIGSKGDITSNAVIKKDRKLKASVMSRQPGIFAGIEEVEFLYKKNNIEVKKLIKDGDRIKKGTHLLELKGFEKDLLRVERSALDILQRMSGIATSAYTLSKMIKDKVPLAPTRKTQWRYLDKKAVYVGKGLTHRLALWESILIKDNHLKAIEREGILDPTKTSLERAWQKRKTANFIEIEVTTTRQAIHAAAIIKELQEQDKKKPCLIMLDNMSPKKIKETVKELKKKNLYSHILLEASGGITPKTLEKYSCLPIDVISMGYLTNSTHALDIKQYIV